jgi:hypothetical protein
LAVVGAIDETRRSFYAVRLVGFLRAHRVG